MAFFVRVRIFSLYRMQIVWGGGGGGVGHGDFTIIILLYCLQAALILLSATWNIIDWLTDSRSHILTHAFTQACIHSLTHSTYLQIGLLLYHSTSHYSGNIWYTIHLSKLSSLLWNKYTRNKQWLMEDFTPLYVTCRDDVFPSACFMTRA